MKECETLLMPFAAKMYADTMPGGMSGGMTGGMPQQHQPEENVEEVD